MPGTVLGAGDASVNKQGIPVLMEMIIPVEYITCQLLIDHV